MVRWVQCLELMLMSQCYREENTPMTILTLIFILTCKTNTNTTVSASKLKNSRRKQSDLGFSAASSDRFIHFRVKQKTNNKGW